MAVWVRVRVRVSMSIRVRVMPWWIINCLSCCFNDLLKMLTLFPGTDLEYW